ncbi:MAG: hypothetical protein IKZ65_06575 [Lachnospiraceae bacterium]|nr:hypothetical protein [Lachnospiraceae bacterium]
MKLTDELQNKLGNAKSEDEVKKILGETKQNVEEAGVILDDEELDQVFGGVSQQFMDDFLMKGMNFH